MVVRAVDGAVRQGRPELRPPRPIKTSLVFLLAGLPLGGYLIVAEFVVGHYPPRLFITAHVHLLLVGFMLMIVMGVATWMFPMSPALRFPIAGAGLGQLFGAALFVVNMWSRVRMPGAASPAGR